MDNAPIQAIALTKAGLFDRIWSLFFTGIVDRLNGKYPVPLPTYTVANMPSATSYERCLIYISNESDGKTVAFSDGTNWRRVQDRAIIS